VIGTQIFGKPGPSVHSDPLKGAARGYLTKGIDIDTVGGTPAVNASVDWK